MPERFKQLLNQYIAAFLPVLVTPVFIFFLFSTAFAQSTLSSITSAERSDGKGYVVRLSMSEPADSFRVFQPSSNLIQLAVYTSPLDTSEINVYGLEDVFQEIELFPSEGRIGINIVLDEGNYFIADAYGDFASEDLLVGLTEASESDVSILTEGMQPIEWKPEPVASTEPPNKNPADTTGALSDTALTAQVSDTTLPDALPDSAILNSEVDDSLNAEALFDNSYYMIKKKLEFDVVVIDPGHGGKDPGAIGHNGIKEKDVVLAVAKKVGHYINKYIPDVEVVYTRDDDSFVGLSERGTIANKHEGDLFISIHANAARDNRARGAEVWFLGQHRTQSALEVMVKENSVVKLEEGTNQKTKLSDEELMLYQLANSGYMATSQAIAGMLERQFGERAVRKSRGVKQAGFMVLYHASMPAILVELGFISNPSEQRFLASDYGQSIMASAIFRTIRNFKEQYELSQTEISK